MSHGTTTFHFGIAAVDTARRPLREDAFYELPISDFAPDAGEPPLAYLVLEATEFRSVGGSFNVWGEPFTDVVDDAIHVICEMEVGGDPLVQRTTARDLAAVLERAMPEHMRVVDYVVATDSVDWSEGAVVHGRYA